jgi:hypothetical protein
MIHSEDEIVITSGVSEALDISIRAIVNTYDPGNPCNDPFDNPNYIGKKKELPWGRKIQNFFARKLAYLSYNKSGIIYVGILGNLLAIPFILIPCVIFIYLGWEGFGPYCIGCISPFASICAWMWFKGEW